MSSAKRFTLPLAFLSLAFLAGCGNSNSVTPNSEGFTQSNLTGTYVFFSQGYDANAYPLNLAGAFTANGTGGITGGTLDAVDQAVSIATNQPITSGSYTVQSDGRGQVTLNVSSLSATFILDFVLTSGPGGAGAISTHGLVTEYDQNGSGSGTLDLQTAIAGQSSIAGPYAFAMAGSDSGGNSLASVGSFTLNSAGTITVGVADFSDSGLPTLGSSLSGSALLSSGTSPGTASLSANGFGTLSFDFYPIDTTHFKVVETDNSAFLAGDVFTQTGASIPSGPMAFTMSGGLSGTSGVGNGGVMTSDGTGNFTGGLEDFNNGVLQTQVPFSGTAASGGSVGGRVIVNLTGFLPASQWVVYPSSGGLLMLESDTLNTTIGSAFAQTSGATLSTTQGYGLNLSAFNSTDGYLENDIAEFATVNSAYAGVIDVSDDTGDGISLKSTTFGVSFTGPDSNGEGSATTTAKGSSYVGFNFYMVDDSTVLFLETDTTPVTQVGTGVFGLQTSSQSSVMSRGAFSTARPLVRAHAFKKQAQKKK